MPFLNRNGVKVHYQVRGEADKIPLLMCNGYGPPIPWVTELYMPNFVDRFQCATYDLRGMGLTDGPQDEAAYDMRELARDAIAVMDEMGWETAHVWGASMGANQASTVAILAPERVRSLTISGPDLGNINILQKKYAHTTRDRAVYASYVAQQKEDPYGAVRRQAEYYFMPDLLARNGELVELVGKMVSETPAHRIWPSFERLIDNFSNGEERNLPDHADPDENVFPIWKHLHEIKVPTLIMQGYDDRLIHRDSAVAVLNEIPNAELRIFKPFGHSFCASPEIQRQQADWIWDQEQKRLKA